MALLLLLHTASAQKQILVMYRAGGGTFFFSVLGTPRLAFTGTSGAGSVSIMELNTENFPTGGGTTQTSIF